MRISCIQIPPEEGSSSDHFPPVRALIERARGSDLIVLPELWPVGYFAFDRYLRSAVKVDGAFVRQCADAACELNSWLHIGSVIETDGSDYYNTSLLFDRRGRLAGKYRKIHLFGFESDERSLLRPGREVVVVDTEWGRTGLAICYDLRFPELFRAMVDRGASTFLAASAWPAARTDAWRLLARARALENQAVVIATNGCGYSRGVKLAGHSTVVGADGVPIGEAGDAPEILTVDFDPCRVTAARRSFQALNDRVTFLNPPNSLNFPIHA